MRSPRGKITIKKELGPSLSLDDLAGIAQGVLAGNEPLAPAGLRFEKTAAGTVAFGPDWIAEIRDNLDAMRKNFKARGGWDRGPGDSLPRRAAIEAAIKPLSDAESADVKALADRLGMDVAALARGFQYDKAVREAQQQEELDGPYWASRALSDLSEIERALAAVDKCEPAARNAAYGAVRAALLLAHHHHLWTIADHENKIVAHEQSVSGARRGGKARAESHQGRNAEMVRDYQQRLPKTKLSPSALMAEIGKRYRLSRSQSIAIINGELKKLSGRRGKSDK
jgi:hypothetical protein